MLALGLIVCACRSQEPEAFGAPVVIPAGATHAISVDDVGERWQPAVQALRAAVESGDDVAARAVLARLRELGPEGPALEVAEAYERILDGRALIAGLDLGIEAEYQRTDAGGLVTVVFRAASADPRALDLAPGPATLSLTRTTVNAEGDETRALEVLPVLAPLRFLVGADAPVRIPLAQVPLVAPKGSFATRARFDLELRSGTLAVDGRELPAQRWTVAPGEVVLLARELAGLELAQADALSALVADGKCDAREALSLAVRVPPAERGATLDLLASRVQDLPETVIGALAPALRWLAPEVDLGRDAVAWRAFLRRRAAGSHGRPTLILPRPRRSGPGGS